MGIHKQLCGAFQEIGNGQKRGRKSSKGKEEEDDPNGPGSSDRPLATMPQRDRPFKKKKAIYRMGLYDQMEARFLEQVGDIKIYLVSFNDKSPIAKGREDHPVGSAANRRIRKVFIYWNTDRASIEDVKRKLFKIRKDIRDFPEQYRPRVKRGQTPPVTYGRTPFGLDTTSPDDDEDPELYEWSAQMLKRMHMNPKFRKEMAYRMSFPSIFHRSSMDDAFARFLGVHNDFWFHVVARLMRTDGAAIQYTLRQLMREELSKDLDTVLTQGYFEKGDYRAMYFSMYQSVYLTEESSVREVIAAAVQEFSLSGGPAPWDANVTLPAYEYHETMKRAAKSTAPVGFTHGADSYAIWQVVRHHKDYVDSLWEEGVHNSPEFWGVNEDREGNRRIRFTNDVRDAITYNAERLVKKGVLVATRWNAMGGKRVVRYMVAEMAPVAAIKRFPPLRK